MEAKIHKDVVLFKRILTHDKFDDHVEQVGCDTQDHNLLLHSSFPATASEAKSACRFTSRTPYVSLV